MEVQQDCPEPGCWWQKADIARRVMAFLPSQDVLACDLVCKDWAALKVSQGHTGSGSQSWVVRVSELPYGKMPLNAATLAKHTASLYKWVISASHYQEELTRADDLHSAMQLAAAIALLGPACHPGYMQYTLGGRYTNSPATLGP